MPAWAWAVPAIALAVLATAFATGAGPWLATASGMALVGSVVAAVHHAEAGAEDQAGAHRRDFLRPFDVHSDCTNGTQMLWKGLQALMG